MLDFTTIDFETANSHRGSPCSVGLVRVRNGQIVESQHWLIRPPEGADWFDGWNIAIHKITAEMVANAPKVLPTTRPRQRHEDAPGAADADVSRGPPRASHRVLAARRGPPRASPRIDATPRRLPLWHTVQ